MIASLFFVMSAAAGVWQARALGQSAKEQRTGLGFGLRLLVVTLVLLVSAWRGHVFAAAAGWTIGYFLAVFLISRRLA